MKPTARCAAYAGLAFALASGALAKTPEIRSGWPKAPVRVDGTADQWAGLMAPLPDVPVLIGVQNDGSYLYVCLKTSDPKVKEQLARTGLTVWVNGAGKDDRGYGVRFPLGTGVPHRRGARRQPEGTPPPDTGPTIDDSKLELIGPTVDDRFTVARRDADPIQAALGDDSGVTVIELRFPLSPSENHPLAVEAKPGATIAVGLETERPHLKRFGTPAGSEDEEGPGGDSGPRGGWGDSDPYGPVNPGGMGGYGRGHYGGMGRGGGEGGGEMPKPMRLWTRVTLAVAPAVSPAAPPSPHS